VGAALIAALPKAELHVHLAGCVRAGTLAELSRKHDVPLPLPAGQLYGRVNSDPAPGEADAGPWLPLLRVYELICRCLRSRDDFARVAYEAMVDAFESSRVVHQELAFSPSVHMALGVPYADIVEGIGEGIRAAREDHGLSGLAIAAVNREDSAATALAMVETVLAHRTDEVVGVGMDFDERKGAPESFAEAYHLAGRAGLHRTAHAGEHVGGPAGAANVRTCVEMLGCERVDHGYYVLEDESVVRWARDAGVHFDVAFTTSRRALRPWRRACVRDMVRRGLKVNISSDDPALFPTSVAQELRIAREDVGLSTNEVLETVRNGVEASFMAPEDKGRLLEKISHAGEGRGVGSPAIDGSAPDGR
jgi:adenosine deaminase